jgi:hypothetical protein
MLKSLLYLSTLPRIFLRVLLVLTNHSMLDISLLLRYSSIQVVLTRTDGEMRDEGSPQCWVVPALWSRMLQCLFFAHAALDPCARARVSCG